MYSLF